MILYWRQAKAAERAERAAAKAALLASQSSVAEGTQSSSAVAPLIEEPQQGDEEGDTMGESSSSSLKLPMLVTAGKVSKPRYPDGPQPDVIKKNVYLRNMKFMDEGQHAAAERLNGLLAQYKAQKARITAHHAAVGATKF